MVPMWMFPIALATGNTFILKPSEKDPSTALLLAELLKEAGLPDGVFNVINGDKSVVDTLLTSPDVDAVSFVGSTPIAEYIYTTASAHGKRCQALGGAKNHCVLMPDTDLDMAVNAIVGAAFGAAGERCMALSVAVAVGDEIADQLINALKTKVAAMRVGPGLVDGQENDMGPVVSAEHKQKICDYISTGESQGAKIVIDGRDFSVAGNETGFFVGPTLIDEVTPAMTIYQEEIFGPVISIIDFDCEESVIEEANRTDTGLASYVFTTDAEKAQRTADALEFGEVQINGVKYGIDLPHVGIKQSGIGCDCSKYALDDYLYLTRITRAR
jgi:malonate-semialdehyde dehydrogenase (acetylating)/methylmalonate-semialdehyde dehydrogenase